MSRTKRRGSGGGGLPPPAGRRPGSSALELRLALLEERGHALACVLAERDQRELGLEVLERRPELHVLLPVERVAAQAEDGRRLAGQPAGDVLRRRVELVERGRHPVDQAQLVQAGGAPAG